MKHLRESKLSLARQDRDAAIAVLKELLTNVRRAHEQQSWDDLAMVLEKTEGHVKVRFAEDNLE